METDSRLDLLFKTSLGKTYRLSIDNPDQSLTASIIQNAMSVIISNNIITTKYGNLTEIKGARFVNTSVSELAVVPVV
ncbi:DUF2922 domain-containing protein [Haloplasma contractile]|uniref:DUF2922 domain-containing protein n=1 Tax=Haloplasma contractile SSD-17B TaxID=1033810 RepID=U2DYZ9_9MOLU|nr:DUF2922 domain-containing protein [Haloplasma contractile]ERJ13462.1 hypothetical protein HLPCO_000113 [Haloplasma contractile SSD-17B]